MRFSALWLLWGDLLCSTDEQCVRILLIPLDTHRKPWAWRGMWVLYSVSKHWLQMCPGETDTLISQDGRNDGEYLWLVGLLFLIPRNVGHAKHNSAVTAEIVMFGYSEKPHKCHSLEINWTEVGKDMHGLDIPHLRPHGEESEPKLGSLRETHCPNEEGSGLIFLLLSVVSSKLTWVGQTFCSDAQKHPQIHLL